jgi:hypothetical protein
MRGIVQVCGQPYFTRRPFSPEAGRWWSAAVRPRPTWADHRTHHAEIIRDSQLAQPGRFVRSQCLHVAASEDRSWRVVVIRQHRCDPRTRPGCDIGAAVADLRDRGDGDPAAIAMSASVTRSRADPDSSVIPDSCPQGPGKVVFMQFVERPLWVAGVMTGGGCDVHVAVQAHDADGQTSHHPGRPKRLAACQGGDDPGPGGVGEGAVLEVGRADADAFRSFEHESS